MNYTDVVVEAFDVLPEPAADAAAQYFKVRVLSSPAGEMSLADAALCSYDRQQLQDCINQLDTGDLKGDALIAFGRDLASWLLPEDRAVAVRELFEASRAQAGQDGGVRLRLRLSPLLARIPWEFLYLDAPGGGGLMDGFLALDPSVAIVRHETLPARIPTVRPPDGEPLKAIAALALAADLPHLDLQAERENLKHIFEIGGVNHTFVEQSTIEDILNNIPDVHIFHFAGHGEFKTLSAQPRTFTGTGALALADQQADSEQISLNVRGNKLRLAVLGACETARRGGANVVNLWGAVAPMLAKAGIPAIVANQFKILDKSAIAFSKAFYQALFGGLSIERAVVAGRLAIYNEDKAERDWGVPVLYMRAPDGRLFGGVVDQTVREQARSAAEHTIHQWHSIVTGGAAVMGDIFSKGEVNIGNTTVGGDWVKGDKVMGDKVGGDKIDVGNITGSSGIAIGRSAQASVSTDPSGSELTVLFQSIHQQIKARPHDSAVDKEELAGRVERIQREVAKGDDANQTKVERWLGELSDAAPDIAGTVISGLRGVSSRLGSAIRQLVERLR
jgi:hypothetical protein